MEHFKNHYYDQLSKSKSTNYLQFIDTMDEQQVIIGWKSMTSKDFKHFNDIAEDLESLGNICYHKPTKADHTMILTFLENKEQQKERTIKKWMN